MPTMPSRLVPLAASLLLALGAPLVLVACSSRTAEPGARPTNDAGSARTTSPSPSSPPPPSSPSAPLSSDQCRSLLDRTNRELKQAIAQSDRACQADADCVEVRASCAPGCGGGAIARKDAERHRQATATLADDCRRFEASQCVTTIPLPVPSCPMYRPRCAAGLCENAPVYGQR